MQDELILFEAAEHGFALRLAHRYVTKERLESLFQVTGDVIIVDASGEEISPDESGRYPQLRHNKYIVVDEQFLNQEENAQQQQAPFCKHECVANMRKARLALISELYHPRHPHLYKLSEDCLVPGLVAAVNEGTREALLSYLHKETGTGIYSLDMFTEKFCQELIEEVENFERSGLPVIRPNSMNNYGVILDEIGFTPMLSELRTKYISPFAALLYPEVGGDTLDSHHGFIVQYKMEEDKELGFHYDASEVTLNVCLGKEFEGGSLYFCGLLLDSTTHDENFEYVHSPGKAILHQGKHCHGANPITMGERYNLIVWCKSQTYRASLEEQACGHHHH